MKPDDAGSSIEASAQKLLDMLTRTGKYLEGLNIDPALVRSYNQLLRYLRTRPLAVWEEILGGQRGTTPIPTHKDELSEEEIRALSSEKIMELAADRQVPRRNIERIASVRFGMTRGGLSSLRNREALIDKLRALIANETTHDAIARAAAQRSGTRQGGEV